ncbi:MAG TPA: ribosomal protein S18-alanine N-acetyltransferase [Acidimicrobiales bacterium]|nr:ribosomal protein S18-alanine N-acetyltransferase [Acidimicrobiales bacterium]
MTASRLRPGRQAPADVVLVPMRRRHLRSVLRIESEVYPRPWSLSLFMSELSLRGTRAYHVAKIGGDVVGYAGVMVGTEDAHVTTIAVDPEHHRRKIGTRLMLNLARVALERGARNLTLEVRVGNTGAQALYHRFGFSPAGIRKNYYSETNEDALVMWASDIDSPGYTARLAAIEAELAADASRWRRQG